MRTIQICLIAITAALAGSLATLAAQTGVPDARTLRVGVETPVQRSTTFEWAALEARPTQIGMRRTVMRAPTPTLDELEIHITTLNVGQASHEPHRHPAEELLIVKDGTVETLQNGKATRLGPGSIIFHSSNDLHNIRNVGSIPATYHVIQWKTAATAQPAPPPLALNHVAIAVPDMDEGIRYYTKALGLKEAFTFRDERGSPLSYLQISRDTFLELQGATATRPPGLIHIGLEVADLKASTARFRAGGLIVRDPSTSARTGAVISQAEGLGGLRFELLEFGANSLQRKVINEWKP
jgi:catechol 2,3-dioxygenase-like lactoylglutathione lyase family enzyme/quercetin dioxygenase-like cupin family protein